MKKFRVNAIIIWIFALFLLISSIRQAIAGESYYLGAVSSIFLILYGWDQFKNPRSITVNLKRASSVSIITPFPFIAETDTPFFHKVDCPHVQGGGAIAEFRTREEAANAGYEPCSQCKP